jgi:hypothetical protein
MLFRVLRSLLLASVMYFSLRYLGFSQAPSLLCALIPLLLGALNVLIGVAVAMSGLAFLVCCTFALAADRHVDLTQVGTLASTFMKTVAK